MPLQEPDISVIKVHIPWNNDIRSTPGSSATAILVRGCIRNITGSVVLCIADVIQPFGIKLRHIEVINRRPG